MFETGRRPRVLLVGLMLVVTTVMVSTEASEASQASQAIHPPAPTFQGLTPARVLETRVGPAFSTVDGLYAGGGPLAAASRFDVQLTGRAGVPIAGVGAVALNVTAINPSEPSFVTLWPTGFRRPTASNLNLAAGRTLPNAVVVQVGAGGQVSIWNDRGGTHLAVDVLGWWPVGTALVPLNPARLVDTRSSAGATTVDGLQQGSGPLGPGEEIVVVAGSRADVPARGVAAVVVNVTAVNPSEASFLTVWPGEGPRPGTSNLNLAPRRTLPNLVIVALDDSSVFRIYNDRGETHLAVDVLAWIPDNGSYRGLSPARLADTRTSAGSATVDGLFKGRGPLGTATSYDIAVRGRGGVPSAGVGAVALNVTAINPTDASFVTVWPAGRSRPVASNLNLAPGRTLPNLVIVPLGEGGRISVYNERGATHVAVDVLGWFPLPGLTTTRVSVTPTGGEVFGSSERPSISADGRFIAYQSDGAVLPGGPEGVRQVYVHDRQTGLVSRVSRSSGGTAANDDASLPSISADGRYVAFQSFATNLTGDSDVGVAVYRHDRVTGTTVLVAPWSEAPSISASGRYVAFESGATDLVPDDTNDRRDIFVWDAQGASISRATVAQGGGEANDSSYRPVISADGRYVAFDSFATNLTPGPDATPQDVFRVDRQTQTTVRISVSTGGVAANDSSYVSSISASGRHVVFASPASNLVSGDTNGSHDVFVRDVSAGTTARVSSRADGSQFTTGSLDGSISADGRYVAFARFSTFFSGGVTVESGEVYLRDLQGGVGAVQRLPVGVFGALPRRYLARTVLSADARYVAFESPAPNLVPDDSNERMDVFVFDHLAG